MNPEHPEDPGQDGEWIDIASFDNLDEANDRALVALALGESIRVDHGDGPGTFEIQSEPASAPRVTREIAGYESELLAHKNHAPVASNWGRHPAGVTAYLFWAAILLLVFRLQFVDPTLVSRAASSSTALIRDGEWWRPFTALFLHGDGPHIVGNLATGAVFGMLVSKSLGPWKGWALILLSGAVGNATTSIITYPQHFTSLGASTAVFGALGILSGIGLVENFREKIRLAWIRTLAPLLAGFVLLGWLGGAEAGAGTDVFGHVFGFAAGVLAGAVSKKLDRPEQPPSEVLNPL